MALIRCGAGAQSTTLFKAVAAGSSAGSSECSYTVTTAGTYDIMAVAHGAWTGSTATGLDVDVLINNVSVASSLTETQNDDAFTNDHLTTVCGKITVAANDVVKVTGTLGSGAASFTTSTLFFPA